MTRRRCRKGAKQAEFGFLGWGGARPGAGRKPGGARACVSHKARPALASRFPVHVTVRLRDGLPGLRSPRPHEAILGAFLEGRERAGFRLVHYSIQISHHHLIVEAKDAQALSRGMQGLNVRLSRALNRCWGRRGRVFDGAFHEHILRTPREVRNALVYVLQNARRHGSWHRDAPDPYSSGAAFDGWRDFEPRGSAPVVEPHTWLLRMGWRRYGLISLSERPSSS